MFPDLLAVGLIDLPEDLSGQPDFLLTVARAQTLAVGTLIEKQVVALRQICIPGERDVVLAHLEKLHEKLAKQHERLMEEMQRRHPPTEEPTPAPEAMQPAAESGS